MLRAIIVDDVPLSVKRLAGLLADSGEVDVRRTFLSAGDACEYAKANPIDIAFLDIDMPGMNGMKLSGKLHEIDDAIDVIFVTAHSNYAIQAFDISALDYLLKPVSAQRMSKALEKIRKRHRSAESREDPPIHSTLLTEQEMKVLRLVAEGLTNKAIAARMNITGETVKFHNKNVFRKLGVINRVQALQRARELRILG